ncbi:MAG TPA: zinc transporter ZupT [Candidatus Krumholzibacteria bacterium]|nr:zinc transporter ZupT [Candidatus Krumholzibacteria bacterium]
MLEGPVLLAFGLTLFAGLSTGIGSAIAFFSKRTNARFLAVSLGLSAGVMIYVSFVEIIAKAHDSLAIALGEPAASWATTGGFFAGILVMAALDRLPALEGGNPHELRRVEEMTEDERRQHRLMRMGLFSAFAIALHNFPEGLATFLSTLEDPSVGVSIAVAIAIHNIPEGIAVAVPIYYATGSRKRAFRLSFLSGLSEPLGAALGYFLLRPFMSDVLFGTVFAGVAGVMVFISLDELLPAAEQYGEHHGAIYGLISGMAIMALSLLLFL